MSQLSFIVGTVILIPIVLYIIFKFRITFRAISYSIFSISGIVNLVLMVLGMNISEDIALPLGLLFGPPLLFFAIINILIFFFKQLNNKINTRIDMVFLVLSIIVTFFAFNFIFNLK